MGQLKKLFSSLSWKQRITILIAAIVAGAGVFSLVHWKRESDFRPLFTSMAPEDAGAVVQKIKETGTDYRLAENGSTVLVPSPKLAELRLALAAAGLPKSGRIGFELFDKLNFGATEFVEHINYRRALEGELERSVMSLWEVEQARVHLTFGKDSIYLESRQPAKASVVLRLRAGARLAPQNVLAITHLVSSAVEGLAPEAVSVLDMRGNLLNRPRKQEGAEPSGEMLEYQQKVERDLVAKISSTLEPLLGTEKFRAGASVECDFSNTEESEEAYDPARSVMVSSQRSEDGATSGAAAGVPGTASNLPRPASRPSTSLGGVTRRTENITFQASRTLRRVRQPQGLVKRISISVLVDHGVRWEGSGAKAQRVLVPPSPEMLKSIRDLVQGVTGFNQARGDQLIIESLPFDSTLHLEPPAVPPAPPRPRNQWQELMADRKLLTGTAGSVVFLVLLAAAAIWFVRRKPKTKRTAAVQPALAPAAEARPEPVAATQKPAPILEPAPENRLEPPAPSPEMPAMTSRELEALMQRIRESVTQDATVPVAIVRGWLNEGGE